MTLVLAQSTLYPWLSLSGCQRKRLQGKDHSNNDLGGRTRETLYEPEVAIIEVKLIAADKGTLEHAAQVINRYIYTVYISLGIL